LAQAIPVFVGPSHRACQTAGLAPARLLGLGILMERDPVQLLRIFVLTAA